MERFLIVTFSYAFQMVLPIKSRAGGDFVDLVGKTALSKVGFDSSYPIKEDDSASLPWIIFLMLS